MYCVTICAMFSGRCTLCALPIWLPEWLVVLVPIVARDVVQQAYYWYVAQHTVMLGYMAVFVLARWSEGVLRGC